MDTMDRLKSINALNADKLLESDKHESILQAQYQTQDTILSAVQTLIRYLGQATLTTTIDNPVTSVSTPDVASVVQSLTQVHDTLKTHENTDLTGVTEVLSAVLNQLEAIPKEHPEPVEPIDYNAKFEALANSLSEVKTAIAEQKLIAEAPIVNVPKADVHVHTDLDPLLTKMTEQTDVIKKGQANLTSSVLETQEVSGLITEKFDKFIVSYTSNDFDDDHEPNVAGVKYYFKGKVVAEIKATYNSKNNLTSVKRVKV